MMLHMDLNFSYLLIFGAVCKIEDVEPAAVLYFNLIEEKLDKRNFDKEKVEEEIKKNFRMKGLLVADVKLIKMMDKTLEDRKRIKYNTSIYKR